MKNKNEMKTEDKETLQAVHDIKFEQFLRNINRYDDVVAGKCKCKFCGKVVTLENIACIFPESGTVKFVCDELNCLAKMSQYSL